MGVCGTVEFFWLHQTILPPTPILLHGPLKKPSHTLLFYLSNCYWQKTSTFARVFFFQWSRVKKQRKHYKEHEIMHYYYSFIILKHHFFCHTTPEYTSQNPAAGSLGGGGILVLNSKNHRVNWFSYVLEVPWIRRCLYTYISVLSSFPLLLLLLLLLSTSLKKIYLVVK